VWVGGSLVKTGPKLKHGAPLLQRSMRWTDAQWADACYIGHDRVRELVSEEVARQRRKLLTR
jgi:hypothetical protein